MAKKIEIGQNKPKTTAKVSSLWHFVEWYLALLENTGAIMDEEFYRYYKQLLDYVYTKIAIPQANDILAEYVVYEVEY